MVPMTGLKSEAEKETKESWREAWVCVCVFEEVLDLPLVAKRRDSGGEG